MNWKHFSWGVFLFAAMLCSCSTVQTCVDFAYFFVLDEVAYDQEDTRLFVSGHSNVSYCAEEGEQVEKYQMMQMDLSLDTLEYDVLVERSHRLEKLEAPPLVQILFIGEIACFDCVLQMPTDDDLYLLSFTYDRETIQERIGNSLPYHGSPLLSIYSGGDMLSEFLFLYGQVEKTFPE